MTQGLNARLLAAHAAGDQTALIALYTEAADAAPDEDTAAFFLTQAHVFALEAGHATATDQLRARLIAMGRESAQPLPLSHALVQMP
ncbi:MAG: hypothetical protein AB8B58_09665 [Roseobacter sp.]